MPIAPMFPCTPSTTFAFLQLELQVSNMRRPYSEPGEEILALRISEDEDEADASDGEEEEYDDEEDEEDEHEMVIEDDGDDPDDDDEDDEDDEDEEEDEDEGDLENPESGRRLMVLNSLRPSQRSQAVRRR